jgi:hypothetical protein
MRHCRMSLRIDGKSKSRFPSGMTERKTKANADSLRE